MSYVKTTWETGDVITAEKLNNIEDAVEALDGREDILVVTLAKDAIAGTYTTDVTFADLVTAWEADKTILAIKKDVNADDVVAISYYEDVIAVHPGPGAPIGSFQFIQWEKGIVPGGTPSMTVGKTVVTMDDSSALTETQSVATWEVTIPSN